MQRDSPVGEVVVYIFKLKMEEWFMRHVYEGKTKSVYELEDGNYLLKLKDDVTGENGQIDPGANAIMGELEGMGKASLLMSRYYFELLNKAGIRTHYINANIDENTMTVKPAQPFGEGLEIICRFKAYGSFLRRYGKYAKKEQPLDSLWFILAAVYFVGLELTGATPGKRMVRLRVLRENGEPMTFWASLIRNALRPVDLFFFGFVGVDPFKPSRARSDLPYRRNRAPC